MLYVAISDIFEGASDKFVIAALLKMYFADKKIVFHIDNHTGIRYYDYFIRSKEENGINKFCDCRTALQVFGRKILTSFCSPRIRTGFRVKEKNLPVSILTAARKHAVNQTLYADVIRKEPVPENRQYTNALCRVPDMAGLIFNKDINCLDQYRLQYAMNIIDSSIPYIIQGFNDYINGKL